MRTYYIEDNNGSYWCRKYAPLKIGYMEYWSNEKHPEWSIKNRFQGWLIYVLPLYLIMRILIKDYKVKLKFVKGQDGEE